MNTIYLHKEGISKHCGKKILQLVWTVAPCFILNTELDMILIVLMDLHALDIPAFTADEFIRFFFNCLWEGKFLT